MNDVTRGATETADGRDDALQACPHLRSVDGPWHAATPSRAHRCALLGSGRQTLERQRLHCLGADHVTCPTWLEWSAGGEADAVAAGPGPFVRTAPVVLEGPGLALSRQRSVRSLAGPVTVVVVATALGAFVLSRGPLAPGSSNAGDDGPSSAPAASATAVPATPAASATPSAATPAPTATPVAATPRPQTYKVKRGDTLASIAAQFGTTTRKLARLNGIDDPSLIRVGQVLELP